MEKLFFLIARWIMFIGATIAFVFLIGGGLYTLKLYKTSQDLKVNGSMHVTKKPEVSFDTYKNIQEYDLKIKIKKRRLIELYVLKIIKDGSRGHGFPMGIMPSNLIKGKDAKIVAKYVSNELSGMKPPVFGACASCHGEDGKGTSGMAPNLLELPIYNGLAAKIKDSTSYAPSGAYVDTTKYYNPLQKYSAKIASYINKYAILVDQEGVTIEKVYKFMKDLEGQYNNKNFSILQNQLDLGFKSLLVYGNKFKQSQLNAKEAIVWKDFISWFLKDFDAQIKQENKKYENSLYELEQEKNKKENEVLEAKVELLQLLTALGTALIVFILLTMILVLFKIESNTRKTYEIKKD